MLREEWINLAKLERTKTSLLKPVSKIRDFTLTAQEMELKIAYARTVYTELSHLELSGSPSKDEIPIKILFYTIREFNRFMTKEMKNV